MKPSIPKGTRDFLPEQVVKRKYIFSTIEAVFRKNGYVAIETPTMESLSTLTGKYGEEGDRLLFKVLNNGDFLSKSNAQAFQERNSGAFASSVSKRGLRYDLTVPFARYVVMHQNELALPFKRYQIQPVWRADRPQKGRYQEFYQCDVDVVGSSSLMYEAELVKIYDEVFHELNLKVQIKVNNRKILSGIAEVTGLSDQFMKMTIILDKLDKIGEEGVKTQLEGLGVNSETAERILGLTKCTSLDELETAFQGTEIGLKGIEELRTFHKYLDLLSYENEILFDPSLARGLNYYTGCIFEVKSTETQMGSIGGGGRYDDLTGVFGMKGVSGVGISFGAERIYDIMEELEKFPKDLRSSADILFVTFDEDGHLKAYEWSSELRKQDIVSDVYPDYGKMKKQMKYANQTKVRYVAIIGSNELEKNVATIKNMQSGEQGEMELHEIIEMMK